MCATAGNTSRVNTNYTPCLKMVLRGCLYFLMLALVPDYSRLNSVLLGDAVASGTMIFNTARSGCWALGKL
jgi:hypothetical protein